MEKIVHTSYEIGVYNPHQNVSNDCKVTTLFANGEFLFSATGEAFLNYPTIQEAEKDIAKMKAFLKDADFIAEKNYQIFVVVKNIVEVKTTRIERHDLTDDERHASKYELQEV